jgi:hypothetical protein
MFDVITNYIYLSSIVSQHKIGGYNLHNHSIFHKLQAENKYNKWKYILQQNPMKKNK